MYYFKVFFSIIFLQIVKEFQAHDDCNVYSVVCNNNINHFVLKVINYKNKSIDEVQNYVYLS